jgi:DNA-binding transcriptional ArsR family regulator
MSATGLHNRAAVDYEASSERFRLLGHPERLRILDVLRHEAECVCHLETILQKPQPYISQQLRIMRDAGLLQDEREGTNIFYRLIDEDVRNVLDLILGPVDVDAKPGDSAACICPKCSAQTR